MLDLSQNNEEGITALTLSDYRVCSYQVFAGRSGEGNAESQSGNIEALYVREAHRQGQS